MTALARRPLAGLIRRRPAPVTRLSSPRSHVTVRPANAAPPDAVDHWTHPSPDGLDPLLRDAGTPVVRPPCGQLTGGHFPTPTAPCFYGCEVHP